MVSRSFCVSGISVSMSTPPALMFTIFASNSCSSLPLCKCTGMALTTRSCTLRSLDVRSLAVMIASLVPGDTQRHLGVVIEFDVAHVIRPEPHAFCKPRDLTPHHQFDRTAGREERDEHEECDEVGCHAERSPKLGGPRR